MLPTRACTGADVREGLGDGGVVTTRRGGGGGPTLALTQSAGAPGFRGGARQWQHVGATSTAAAVTCSASRIASRELQAASPEDTSKRRILALHM